MAHPNQPPDHTGTLNDIVLAALNAVPRHYHDGRPVSAGTWNRLVASHIERAAVDAGIIPDPCPAGVAPLRLVTPEWVVASCAHVLSVDVDAILSPSRQQGVVVARQVIAFMLREATQLSLPEIAAVLGRDHTTVMHAIRRVARMMGSDGLWAGRVVACRAAVVRAQAVPA
mgnify:CR=1 FL=1